MLKALRSLSTHLSSNKLFKSPQSFLQAKAAYSTDATYDSHPLSNHYFIRHHVQSEDNVIALHAKLLHLTQKNHDDKPHEDILRAYNALGVSYLLKSNPENYQLTAAYDALNDALSMHQELFGDRPTLGKVITLENLTTACHRLRLFDERDQRTEEAKIAYEQTIQSHPEFKEPQVFKSDMSYPSNTSSEKAHDHPRLYSSTVIAEEANANDQQEIDLLGAEYSDY